MWYYSAYIFAHMWYCSVVVYLPDLKHICTSAHVYWHTYVVNLSIYIQIGKQNTYTTVLQIWSNIFFLVVIVNALKRFILVYWVDSCMLQAYLWIFQSIM